MDLSHTTGRGPTFSLFLTAAALLLWLHGSSPAQVPLEMASYLRSAGMYRPSDLRGTFTVKYVVSGIRRYTEGGATQVTKSLSESGTLTYYFDGESQAAAGTIQKGHVKASMSYDYSYTVLMPPGGPYATEAENWSKVNFGGKELADELGRSVGGQGEIDFGREKPVVILHPTLKRYQVAWFGSTVSVAVTGTERNRQFPSPEVSQPAGTPQHWMGMIGHCVAIPEPASARARQAAAAEAAADMDNEALFANFYAEGSYDTNANIISGKASRTVAVVKGEMMTAAELRHKLAQGEVSEDDLKTDAFWGTIVLTWNLFQKPVEVELKPLDEDEYMRWLPKYFDKDECSKLSFQAQVKEKGKKGLFLFRLDKVSREPGICLNFPPSDRPSPPFDLVFAEKGNQPDSDIIVSDDGQTLVTTKAKESVVVVVEARDMGAYGYLRCEATFLSGGAATATDPRNGFPYVSIPWDDDMNFIADQWEIENHCYGKSADSDDENLPVGDGHRGDGFSLYEEYRGIVEDRGHFRMNPRLKELCVYLQPNVGLSRGISLWESLSGLFIYQEFRPDEFGKDRVVNFNHKTAHIVDQHGLIVQKGNLPFKGGRAEGGPGTPGKVSSVIIEINTDPDPSLVAHELAHGCSVWHHGEADEWKFDSPEDGRKIYLARPQGQHSGVEDCIMRYEAAFRYVGPDGKRWKYAPYIPDGEYLCISPSGTGINAGPARKRPDGAPLPKCGDAAAGRGNCERQICVNDKYANDPKHVK